MILGKLRELIERKQTAAEVTALREAIQPDGGDESELELIVFRSTGLPPSEWRQLDIFGQRTWLRACLDKAIAASGGMEKPRSSDELPNIPDPDPKLIRQLTGNSRALVVYLWKRDNVSLDAIRRDVWGGKEVSDRAIERAVCYCNDMLSRLRYSQTRIEKRDKLFCLIHPQK